MYSALRDPSDLQVGQLMKVPLGFEACFFFFKLASFQWGKPILRRVSISKTSCRSQGVKISQCYTDLQITLGNSNSD